jgi:hypothetical protein
MLKKFGVRRGACAVLVSGLASWGEGSAYFDEGLSADDTF